MKPQDILFFIIIAFLLWKRKPEWFVYAGLICLIISIPFFSFWIFFTGQRLTYYAAGFFAVAVFLLLFDKQDR